MSERRRRATRFGGEPPPKRRKSTTPLMDPIKAKTPIAPQIEADEELPRKVKEGIPLPVLADPQCVRFTSGKYQNIVESGVLATSIERSRSKWLTDGLFERYWTKPSKKKNLTDVYNPAKESMQKLGQCCMTIEPHVFDISLYTLKESQTPHSLLSSVNEPPLPVQDLSYGSPYSNSAPPVPGLTGSTSSAPIYDQQHRGESSLRGTLPPFNASSVSKRQTQEYPVSTSAQARLPLYGGNTFTESTVVPNNDPVIQKLASRAATDHNLKTLMKVVALGDASQDQLRVFQRHIDELNAEIQAKQIASARQPSLPAGSARPYAQSPHMNHSTSMPMGQSHYNNAQHNLGPMAEPVSRYFSQAPQYLKSKTFPPLRQDVGAIVFDFNSGGNGDRYLFPRLSIIEYLPGNSQLLLSFLATQTGSTIPGAKYKDDTHYYQPVTIKLSANNPRVLETFSRVVAPAEEVRKHMMETMTKATLASSVYLATRLPRSNDDQDEVAKDAREPQDPGAPMLFYTPPDSLLPLYTPPKE